jgi:hypothetical protein
MTLKDYSVTAFTVLNGARIVAYLPQMICVHRDRAGALSASMVTWGMFFTANLATVFYALTVSGDRIIAGLFTANAFASIAIFSLILRKRITHFCSDERKTDHSHAWSIFTAGRNRITALLMSLRQRMEDR